VTALIDSVPALAATYKYDPFGRLLSYSGTMASANTYRFSSKDQMPNSGLYYYGYRFYDPNLQRWVNRDPIHERGGANLYGLVLSAPLRYVDPYGLRIGFDPSSLGFPGFIEQWRDCICQLMQSPHGRDLLLRAAAPDIDIDIIPVPGGLPVTGDPTPAPTWPVSVAIGFDPGDPLGVNPRNPRKPPADELPPSTLPGCAVILAHELGHALGSEDEGEHDSAGSRGDNVARNENPVRDDFGLPPRLNYHGYPVFPIVAY